MRRFDHVIVGAGPVPRACMPCATWEIAALATAIGLSVFKPGNAVCRRTRPANVDTRRPDSPK